MKSHLYCFIPIFGVALLAPTFGAEPAPNSNEPAKDMKARKEIRVITSTEGDHGPGPQRIMRRLEGPAEMESVTFLGVETGPVNATLAAQLGLTEGSGLVVNHLVPASPAAAVLKPHDILLKLDDQILIEQRQLAVLVRGHKDGDEVTLTYLRGGKSATAKVKLGKHEVPKVSMMNNQAEPGFRGMRTGEFPVGGSGMGGGNFELHAVPPDARGNREDVNRILSLMDGANGPGQRRITVARPGGPGDRNVSVTVNTGNSRMISDDDKGSLELTINDGKKELVAKNQKGEKLFAGPVNTPEERKALPDEVRERLEKLEDMKQLSFRTDGDFKGAETKIMRPRGQGISLPPQPPVPSRLRNLSL